MRFSVFNSDAERREGLKTLLRQIDRQARFGEAQDWPQVERTLRRLQPDLLLIDWEDWMSPLDARTLLANHPGLPVAVLVDDISPAHVRAFVEKGVLGVIPRSTDPRVIVRALEMVLLGVHYIPAGALSFDAPAPSSKLVRPLNDARPLELVAPPKRPRLGGGLSPRQEQIMRCVHMGSTNKMIARALGISEGTVKIHLATIFQQLGAPNRAAAVAIYNGWLTAQLGAAQRTQSHPAARARDVQRRATAPAQAANFPLSVACQRHCRRTADGRRSDDALRHTAQAPGTRRRRDVKVERNPP